MDDCKPNCTALAVESGFTLLAIAVIFLGSLVEYGVVKTGLGTVLISWLGRSYTARKTKPAKL